eukprot:scaffold260580_cov34-Prasinocladus_malaysianus.AAC.2
MASAMGMTSLAARAPAGSASLSAARRSALASRVAPLSARRTPAARRAARQAAVAAVKIDFDSKASHTYFAEIVGAM